MDNNDDRIVVYVVDDDDSVREALDRLMRSAGHEVRSSPTIDAVPSGNPGANRGCVVFDLSANRTGTGTVAARLHERGVDLPLIALSGNDGEMIELEARAAGAQFLFRKPVDGRALQDAVAWLATANHLSEGRRT